MFLLILEDPLTLEFVNLFAIVARIFVIGMSIYFAEVATLLGETADFFEASTISDFFSSFLGIFSLLIYFKTSLKIFGVFWLRWHLPFEKIIFWTRWLNFA
jgi:hypothetical protein